MVYYFVWIYYIILCINFMLEQGIWIFGFLDYFFLVFYFFGFGKMLFSCIVLYFGLKYGLFGLVLGILLCFEVNYYYFIIVKIVLELVYVIKN